MSKKPNATFNSAPYKRLCDWLFAKRKEKKLSMRALGEKLGTPHTYVSKIENQERRLDILEYMEYCRALEIDPVEGLSYLQNEDA